MTAKNEHTGDSIISKAQSDAYRDNYDRIFGKKQKTVIDAVVDNLEPFDKNKDEYAGKVR